MKSSVRNKGPSFGMHSQTVREGIRDVPFFCFRICCSIGMVFSFRGRPDSSYPKVRRSESVRGGCRGCGSRGGVCEVSVDVGQQVAHHGWHAGTHVFSRQTGEMPTERRKKAHISCNSSPHCFLKWSSNSVWRHRVIFTMETLKNETTWADALQCCVLTFSHLNKFIVPNTCLWGQRKCVNSLLRSSCFQTESSITANVKVKRLPSGGSAETGSRSECALANLSSSHGGEATHKSLQHAKNK